MYQKTDEQTLEEDLLLGILIKMGGG